MCIYDCEGSRAGIFRVCWCSTTTCVPVRSEIRRAVLCGEHGAPDPGPHTLKAVGAPPCPPAHPYCSSASLAWASAPRCNPTQCPEWSPSISSLLHSSPSLFLEPPLYSLSADDLTACLTEAVEATRGERPQSPTTTPNRLPASVPESSASFLGPRQPPYSAQPGL